ncbi:18679_t:CDS:2 [Entrophospora sp. SA101]|nr:14542_t:CDS:2 [Entrophospora sp. SA101]CAJ0846789.1 18679_t:CDS:2 [Entrophospora sp. SA101]
MIFTFIQRSYRKGEIDPLPIKGEGYYHRHEPAEFTVEEVKNSNVKYTAVGTIFLTDKRIIFIANEPSIPDGFKTFYVFLSDIVSSVTPPKFFSYKNKNVFTTEIKLKNSAVLKLSVNYCGGYQEDEEARDIFEDYYGMLTAALRRIV